MENSTLNDPMGAALLDFMLGKKDAQVLVRSSFDEEDWLTAEYLMRDFASFPDLEKEALSLAQGRILDVGACSGSHSLYLQSQGKTVEAIDISPGCVDVMKQRGLDARLQNFFHMKEEGCYDCILLLMNGLGMGGSLEGLNGLLKKARQLLAPGGFILGDSSDILPAYEQEDGSINIDLMKGYYGQMRYELSYRQHSDAFDWVYIDFHTVEAYAQAAKFTCEHIFTELDETYLVKLTPS